jgi:hypothetical protein
MNPPVKPLNIFIIVLILLVLGTVAWTYWQFDQGTRQSERHVYTYSIDLSYNATIDNVTLLLPVPELNGTPYFTGPFINGTAHGVPLGWNISVVRENGTPMLAIRAKRMVPEYHGYPIPIEPGVSVLPTTRRPGHEYSGDTPVLVPVIITLVETTRSEIDTRTPVSHEPVFFPGGNFTGSGIPTANNGFEYDHQVPVYIGYTSDRPVSVSLVARLTGSNSIWRGAWLSNIYSDTITVESGNEKQGWLPGEGKLVTGGGVYY